MNFNAFAPGVLIYTLYFFLLLIVTFARYNKSNQENKKVFIFFVVLQVLIGGLRSYTVGTDTGSYVESILMFRSFSIDEIIDFRGSRDPYFFVFIRVISQFFEGYTGVFVILQIIFWGAVSFTIFKYSKSCLLALLLLVAFRLNYFFFSGMRQGLAMALVLFSFRYLETRQLVKYVITIVIASFCHQSAVIFIPLFFIHRLRLNNLLTVVSLIAIAIALSFILPDISFDEEEFAYAQYLKSDKSGNYFSLLTVSLSFFYILLRVMDVKLDEKTNTLFSFALFAAMTSVMGLKIQIAYRVAMYFNMFTPIIMTNLLVEKKSYQQHVQILMILLFVLYLITGMPTGLDEYKFFWQTNI